MEPTKAHSVMELDDATKKELHDLHEFATKSMSDVKAELKTLSERDEERDKRLAALSDAVDKSKRRTVGWPETDMRMLKFEPTQKGFDRLLQRSAPAGQKNTEAGMLLEELKHASDDCYIMGKLWEGLKEAKLNPTPFQKWAAFKNFAGLRDELLKALDTATSGEGSQWIPTGFSSQIHELLITRRTVGGLFPTFPMPTNPYTWPFETVRPLASKAAEATGTTNPYDSLTPEAYGSGEPTGAMTLTAAKTRALELASREVSDDAAVALLPFLRSRIVAALGDGREAILINGDTTATHMDTDTAAGAATLVEKTNIGLRKIALSRSATLDIGTFTEAKFQSLLMGMGKYAGMPANNPIICSWIGYWQMISVLPVVKVNEYGPMAVVRTGELGSAYGRPIIVSDFIRDDMDANGVNGASSNTFTGLLAVNTNEFVIGERPGLGVETERLLPSDQTMIVAFDRWDFDTPTPSTTTPVMYGINLELTL